MEGENNDLKGKLKVMNAKMEQAAEQFRTEKEENYNELEEEMKKSEIME